MDPNCPISPIACLLNDFTTRLSNKSQIKILQLLKHNNGNFFIWIRSFNENEIGQGQLNGPFDQKNAENEFEKLFFELTKINWKERNESENQKGEFEIQKTGFASQTEILFNASSLETEQRSRLFKDVPIEEVEDFWNARPCNLRHGIAPIGTKEYFNQVEARKYKVEPHIKHFAEFEKWNNKDVLEIGCGLGTESTNFARNGARLTAVDLSSESVKLAKQRLNVFDLKGNVFVANAEKLSENLKDFFQNENNNSEIIKPNSFKDNIPQFDLVWSFGVLHHTPDPTQAINQIKKLLKKGGELRIMVYAKISYKLFFLMRETGVWDFSLIDRLIGEYSEAQSGCPVTYSYTIDDIPKKLLPENDWEIVDIKKDHIFAYKIPEYKKHEYVREDCFAGISDEEFHELEKELGWHMLVTAKKR